MNKLLIGVGGMMLALSLAAAKYTVDLRNPDGDGSIKVLECQRDKVYTLPAYKAEQTQYPVTFLGWACSNGKRYDNGMLVFNLAEAGKTVTMTAMLESSGPVVSFQYDDDDRLVDTRIGGGAFTSTLTPAGNVKTIKERSGK